MSDQTFQVFVANTSIQHHHLMFALEKTGRLYEHILNIGGQVSLEEIVRRRLTQAEVNYFVATKEKYGYRNVRDVAGEREFVGIVYSLDAPVNLKAIKSNYEHNDDVLNQKRDERLELSAAAIADHLSGGQTAEPNQAVLKQTPLRRSSIENIEETPGEDVPRIGVGVEFAAEGVEPRHAGRRAKTG
jgi:hypothetical protein